MLSIEAWRRSAACRFMGAAVFFDETASAVASAKMICGGCAVRLDCLFEAISEGLEGGVFGGATEPERRAVLRRLGRREAVR